MFKVIGNTNKDLGISGVVTTSASDNSFIIGTSGVIPTGNTSNGYWLNNVWHPYITYPYYQPSIYTFPSVVSYDVQVKKVENGWIIYKDGKEFVITDKKDILKYL